MQNLKLKLPEFAVKMFKTIFLSLELSSDASARLEHNRLNVGRIALERLVGALNQLQSASVGGEPKWD